jgi:hypothetical protein
MKNKDRFYIRENSRVNRRKELLVRYCIWDRKLKDEGVVFSSNDYNVVRRKFKRLVNGLKEGFPNKEFYQNGWVR